MTESKAVLLFALLLLGFPGACSDSTGPDDQLSEARARWDSAGLTTYEYDFTMSCFCAPTAIEPVRVSVANNMVVGAIRVSDGEALPDTDLPFFSTIDELFGRLQSSADQDPEVFDVVFNEILGYPASANVDISFMIADEEYSFTADVLPLDTN